MRKLIKILSLTIFIISCKSEIKNAEPTQQEKIDNKYKFAEFDLFDQKEKIALLAIIKNVNYDTLYLILKEYYSQNSDYSLYGDTVAVVSRNSITSISKKFSIPKSEVASLIFSFKYEMKLDDEIIKKSEQESLIENEKN